MRDVRTQEPRQTAISEAPPTCEPKPATDDLSTDTVTLTSTKTMIPVDVSGEIYTILHPTYELIDSPQRIETSQLQPFLEGDKGITLVFAQGGKALPASLYSIHSTYLEADSDTSTFRHQRGETVLVVFRLSPQPHYVLQTVIDKVYTFASCDDCRKRWMHFSRIWQATVSACHGLVVRLVSRHVGICARASVCGIILPSPCR
jgi:hypothetical protein